MTVKFVLLMYNKPKKTDKSKQKYTYISYKLSALFHISADNLLYLRHKTNMI